MSFVVAVTLLLILKKKFFCTFGYKLIAKFIHDTEHLYSFILVITAYIIVSCCNSPVKLQNSCKITNFYETFLIPN